MHKAALLFIALLCPILATAAEPARYDGVESYATSIHGTINGDIAKGYGELTGPGHKDWAGLVSTQGNDMPQLVVLTQDQDGKYLLAATVQTQGGGTSNSAVDSASIAKSSVYVSSSWNWHGCGGGATHQYKIQDGQWRLIGVRIQRSTAYVTTDAKGEQGYDVGDTVDIDRNVLTGNVIVHFKPRNKKAVTKNVHLPPELLLLKDYDQDQGSLTQFDQYAQC